jgi:hypothetical protein
LQISESETKIPLLLLVSDLFAACAISSQYSAMSLDDFFLKHSLCREKEDDEVGPNARADWVDTEAEESEGVTLASAGDPAGPWVQNPDIPEPLRRAAMAEYQREQWERGNQTGVKGVLADYREHQNMVHMERERAALERKEVLRRMCYGATFTAEPAATVVKPRDADDDGVDEEEEEADFMESYRAQRMQELQGGAGSAITNTGRDLFGEVKEVDKFQMVDEIDKESRGVAVVVHLYEEFVAGCRVTNKLLEPLARKNPHVKFLRIRATEANKDFDHVALPALLIYMDGELQNSLMRITDDLGEDFPLASLEGLLIENEVLDRSVYQNAANSALLQRTEQKAALFGEMPESIFTAMSEMD